LGKDADAQRWFLFLCFLSLFYFFGLVLSFYCFFFGVSFELLSVFFRHYWEPRFGEVWERRGGDDAGIGGVGAKEGRSRRVTERGKRGLA
jgi:hypothetical protein